LAFRPADILAVKRRYKPERIKRRFTVRPENLLVSVVSAKPPPRVLIDTTVYIHRTLGKLPEEANRCLDSALVYHSAICMGEILRGLAALDPASVRYPALWAHYSKIFGTIPDRRLVPPTPGIIAEASIISGLLSRTQNYQKDQTQSLFNDAAIFFTAAALGIPVLTANRDDFDLIQQAAGHGEFIHYTAT